jgi:hypothetical protein
LDLTKDRELKAKAAYLAAKAELGGMITAAEAAGKDVDALPVPATWCTQLKTLSDTQYYRDVLRECGHFAGCGTLPLRARAPRPPPGRSASASAAVNESWKPGSRRSAG